MTPRSGKRITVVLFEDHPLAPEGVGFRLRARDGFQVLAAAAETGPAQRRMRGTHPDLVLLDLQREGEACLTLAGAMHHAAPGARLVLMGLDPAQQDVLRFVRAGISGFIMADATFARVLRTCRSVARGMHVLPAQLTCSLFGQLRN